MQKVLVGAVMMALAGVAFAPLVHADTAEASCVIRNKHGDRKGEQSGPCTFGQRQGYIDVRLKDGDTISLSPVGNGPAKYRDQSGQKVSRTSATSGGMEFRWDAGKQLSVTWRASGGSRDYSAPAATAPGMSPHRENAEWQRGFNDGLAGRYDQDRHPQPYKDGVAAGEEAARKNAHSGGGGGDSGDYFVNELDHGGFEIVWKRQSCFISYNAGGRSMSVSPGCNDKQIRRSDEIARDRTR